MIRPFTFLCLIMFFGSGLYLYTAKHKALLLDHEIGRLVHEAQETRARATLLNAEYDLLCAPDRLTELSSQVLALQSTSPGQFSTLADIGQRLDETEKRIRAAAPTPAATDPQGDKAVADKPNAEKPNADKPGAAATAMAVASAGPRPAPRPSAPAAAPATPVTPAASLLAALAPTRPPMRATQPPGPAQVGSSLGLARSAVQPMGPISQASAQMPVAQHSYIPAIFTRTAEGGNR